MHSCPACHRRFSPAAYVRYLLRLAVKASLRDDVPAPHLMAMAEPVEPAQDRHARHMQAAAEYRRVGA